MGTPAPHFCPEDGGRMRDAFSENFSPCPGRYVNYPIYYNYYCYLAIVLYRIAFPKSSDKNLARLPSKILFKVRFLISAAALEITDIQLETILIFVFLKSGSNLINS